MKHSLIAIVSFCLSLFCSIVNAQQVTLISAGSNWKYLSNGTNQGTAWRATSFNDTSWNSGNAQLGYGDGDEATLISYGPSASNKYMTYYFRQAINISNPASYSNLVLSIKRDDGAVVYINGTKAVSSNMPNTYNYTTAASSGIEGANENVFYTYSIQSSLLVAGNNVIAVEVHQRSKTSTDVSFDLKLEGNLNVACGSPSALTTTNINSTNGTISWSSVPGASGYNVQYRISGASSWTTILSANTNIILNGLTSATNYEWNVQAVCGTVLSAFTATANFTTLSSGIDTLIKSNTAWKYLANGSNQGTAWRSSGFNDAAWPSGNAELGYGDGDEATVVSYGSNSTSKYITTYFRKTFNVANPQIYSSLTLNVVRDDGIVVYLNGSEVYRNNMPSGTIGYLTKATASIGGTDESAWNNANLNPASLLQGNNVLAVEIHQQAASSSDISFNLRLIASDQQVPPVIRRGAYLQKLTPTSIVIRWRTDKTSDSKVKYGTTLAYTDSVTDPASTTEHSVELNGLNQNTKYFYSIGTSLFTLQGDSNNNFYTAPVEGTIVPVRIWAIGDFGNGTTAQTAVRDAYVNYTGSIPTNLWIWLGDDAYETGTDAQFQTRVFEKYPQQFKQYPLYPSPGNHDYAEAGYQSNNTLGLNFPYFSIFTVPQNAEAGGIASGTPKYYSYNYANIHFISLDSYGAYNNSGSPMYQWLNNDLASNTQRWTIVYFHHTPYSKGTHNTDVSVESVDMRTNIIPLLESYHVDMVLCGHSHINERSYLIKNHYGIANSFNSGMMVSGSVNTFIKTPPFDGTVYAVCGTSGQAPGPTQVGYPMQCMAFSNNSSSCSMVIDVMGDDLAAKFLTTSGSIIDQFTISKTGSRLAAQDDAFNPSISHHPGETMISYYLTESAALKIELYNLVGEKIALFNEVPSYQEAGFYQYRLQLPSAIAKGVYILKILMNDKMYTDKMVVN